MENITEIEVDGLGGKRIFVLIQNENSWISMLKSEYEEQQAKAAEQSGTL